MRQHENNPRSTRFLFSKYAVFLEVLRRGWVPQDVFFDGGPDFVAFRGRRMRRFKVRYATRGDSGYVFSAGGKQTRDFYELSVGCDVLVLVCLFDNNEPAGFYIFPSADAPKTKMFLHPTKGPFPKYAAFYGGWGVLGSPVETVG